MKLDTLTATAFAEMFRNLIVAYNERIREKWLEQTIAVYYGQVRYLPDWAVREAIDRLIAEPMRSFPKAGQLAWNAREAVKRRENEQRRQQKVDLDVCPLCESKPSMRTWYVFPHCRADLRPVVTHTFRGEEHRLVEAKREYCDCTWERMKKRLHPAVKDAMGGVDDLAVKNLG